MFACFFSSGKIEVAENEDYARITTHFFYSNDFVIIIYELLRISLDVIKQEYNIILNYLNV